MTRELWDFQDPRPPTEAGYVDVPLGAPDRDHETLRLPLHRHDGEGDFRGAVLLLHGASAASRTFHFPRPRHEEPTPDLVGFLTTAGYDVWLLDWRGGLRVAGHYQERYRRDRAATLAFNLDNIARHDLPLALGHIQRWYDESARHGDDVAINVIGHCVGAGTMAMAIGAGHARKHDLRLGTVVLSTLGLFATVPWDGWTKANDQALERCYFSEPETFSIDPDVSQQPWPRLLEEAYEVWPRRLLPDGDEVFRRVTFMFGRPFLAQLVDDELSAMPEIGRQFGKMPLGQYIQLGEWVRRGFVAELGAYSPPTGAPSNDEGASRTVTDAYLHPEHFTGLHVRLITGEHNMLWHADSVHRMHEWLRGARCGSLENWIVPGHAHQDLFWAHDAPARIFPWFAEALR
ncbi:MAG: hypothetical protein PVI30_04530 [Myxococcales bacterium]|jgi:hypothetical protein